MDRELLWRLYTTLPSDAQRQVADFIAFLAARYQAAQSAKPASVGNLADEPIVGMWADRADLVDSSAWVRTTRQQEWDRHDG